MKRLLWSLTLICIATFCVLFTLPASASPILPPPPTTWVTDTAGFLSSPTRQALNTRLAEYEHSSGHQVIVWIGKTSGDDPIEDWAARTFQSWRIGRKGIDDGLALFLLKDDRAVRIEVGYGLEEKVTDATSSRIIREVIVPRIQSGDRDGAVTQAVDRLITSIEGKGAEGEPATARPTPLNLPAAIAAILIGIVVVGMLVMFAIRYPTAAWYIASVLLSRGDFSGGNGDFGSGRGSGGRFGGGGFSGGGGRSGGGGASGRW